MAVSSNRTFGESGRFHQSIRGASNIAFPRTFHRTDSQVLHRPPRIGGQRQRTLTGRMGHRK